MSQSIDEAVHPRRSSTRRWTSTDFPELGEKYEGKVRDCYIARRHGAR